MLPEIIIDTPANLAEILAARIEGDGLRALAARGRFALALPGGSVARTFFPRLARGSFDWSRADFFWSDERAVPATDAASNYGLARALWLDPAKIPADRVHRMEADGDDLEGAAAAYANDLTRLLGQPPRLDIVLLGVGADGHVCSLFPGHALLREEQKWVAVEAAAPTPPAHRLTLTLPALAAAELVVVAAMGETKARAVRAALHDLDSSLPLALALRRARKALVLLDPDAASRGSAYHSVF
jgi:6-phosphogluconolactonase